MQGETLLESMARKLHPKRFPDMSMKMAAILGAMLGKSWTTPALVELCITSDGYLLGRKKGGLSFEGFLGTEDELKDNLERLINIPEVGLTEEEKQEALKAFRDIKRWGEAYEAG